jgi:hypothetical protein
VNRSQTPRPAAASWPGTDTIATLAPGSRATPNPAEPRSVTLASVAISAVAHWTPSAARIGLVALSSSSESR